jgi:hypothetical protein
VKAPETMKAPPFIKVVAASGTTKTLMPNYVKSYLISAIAVVLPAQGPPVKQTRTMFEESLRCYYLIEYYKLLFAVPISLCM